MRRAEEIRIPAWGPELAARWWPGEGTPLLALHGWLDNANSFVPLVEHLGHPVLALDFAGHGHSGHRGPGEAVHFIDHVRDVHAAVEAMGWDRFVLLGHSMGAAIACLYAATFPVPVERLVLIEGLGPPTTPACEAPATLRKAIAEMGELPQKRKPVYEDPDQAVRARMNGFGGLGEAPSRLLCERGLEKVPGGWTWHSDARLRLTSSLRLTEEQVEGFLRAIVAPTLLVLGNEGMGGTGVFDHRTGWLADLRIERLPGRHHLHMEAPAAVARLVEGFLHGPAVEPDRA